jgi:hypothetical protein
MLRKYGDFMAWACTTLPSKEICVRRPTFGTVRMLGTRSGWVNVNVNGTGTGTGSLAENRCR